MGRTNLGPYEIRGKYYNYGQFGPTNVPFDFWRKNKDRLEEVRYTSALLGKVFPNKDFSGISFVPSEFYKLPFDKLVRLAHTIGLNYIASRKATDIEKRALRKGILRKLEA